MSYKISKLPLLLERVGVRRIKSSSYIPPHPNLLPQGRRSWYLCRYLCPPGEGWGEGGRMSLYFYMALYFLEWAVALLPHTHPLKDITGHEDTKFTKKNQSKIFGFFVSSW
jgi:hypothetical protein